MPYDQYGYYEIDPSTGMVRRPNTQTSAKVGDYPSASSLKPGTFGQQYPEGWATHQAAPYTQVPQQQSLQDWYNVAGSQFPRFNVSDLTWTPQQYSGMGEPDPYNSGGMINLANAGNYGHFSNLTGPMTGNSNYQISGGGGNGAWTDPFAGNSFGLQMKSGDKAGTYVTYNRQGDSWVPDVGSGGQREWDTNPGGQNLGFALPIGMFAGANALGPLFGGEPNMLTSMGGGGGEAAAAGGIPGATAESLWPGLAGAGGGGVPGGYAGAISTGGAGLGAGMVGGAASQLPSWQQALGGIGNAFGGGSSLASGIGGLIGGGLGYLDAKNQPNSITTRTEIDPRLAEAAYGTQGVWPATQNLMNTQLGQPNPGVQAGQQISAMGQQGLPNWASLVDQAKGQWDANPWIKEQQTAITNDMTRNLLENIMPNIGSQAQMAGGYGGSRQGVMQALANSRMNQDLAPALANLASNAWESGQNRALSSAGQAGNYGLNQQAQQAGLLGTGANLQMQSPWLPINNASNVMRGLPGNTSVVNPLFTNPWASAIGGASLGSQIGGGTNWNDIFGGIGGLLGGLFGR